MKATAGKPMQRALNVVSHIDVRYGGICATNPGFSRALAGTGRWDVSTIGFAADDETSPFGAADGSLHRVPRGRRRWLTDGALRRELRDRIAQSDVVHIHGLWEEHSATACAMAHSLGKPYVVSAHGMLDPWAIREKGWKKALYAALIERRHLRRAACLRAVTPGEIDDYGAFGVARGPFAVLPLGVDTPLTDSPERFHQQFPGHRDAPIVLFLSRLHHKKGLDLLAPAFAEVRKSFPSARLVLAGPESPDTQPQLLRSIRELGITEAVTFTGMVTGELKWSTIAAATVFVLPSYSENFAVAISEAMALGRPVLATRQCNRPEVGTSNAGWIIEPELAALTATLRAALSLPAGERDDLGRNGKRLVAERYSWSAIGVETANLYEWVAGRGPVPACVANAPRPGQARSGGAAA